MMGERVGLTAIVVISWEGEVTDGPAVFFRAGKEGRVVSVVDFGETAHREGFTSPKNESSSNPAFVEMNFPPGIVFIHHVGISVDGYRTVPEIDSGVFLNRLEAQMQMIASVDVVGIKKRRPRSGAGAQTMVAGPGMPAVYRQGKKFGREGELGKDFLQDSDGIVLASVIHHHQFKVIAPLPLQRSERPANQGAPIVSAKDNREHRSGLRNQGAKKSLDFNRSGLRAVGGVNHVLHLVGSEVSPDGSPGSGL